jgi:hypothetical protein
MRGKGNKKERKTDRKIGNEDKEREREEDKT